MWEPAGRRRAPAHVKWHFLAFDAEQGWHSPSPRLTLRLIQGHVRDKRKYRALMQMHCA